MIRREAFVNKIREMGFTFRREASRVLIFRRGKDTAYIQVPRKDDLDEQFVIRSLTQHGCSLEEALAFIGSHRC